MALLWPAQRVMLEIIYDTHHVHQGSFLSAYHAKQDKLIMVSDAIRATGMKEARASLGTKGDGSMMVHGQTVAG
ncbi:MAG: hypothetical protein R2865_07015 [Deinococcales bacterium]